MSPSSVRRDKQARPDRGKASKRRLQIELMNLATRLGRLPTRLDVERFSEYRLEAFDKAFRSWGEALKAARTVVLCDEAGLYEAREELSEPGGDEAPGLA